METFMLWKEIGILCGTGKDLIVFKLLYGLQLKSASLPIFVEASGEWAYLHFVLDVGENMKLPFMCSGIVSMQLRDWIFNNLGKCSICTTTKNWKTIFMTSCWFLWTWRNKAIFENDFHHPNNHVMVIQDFTRQIDICSTLQPHRNIQRKETIYVGWDKRPEGWIKLNSDGACNGGGENSGCGGLFRSSDGRWLKDYIRKVGVCDALHAEMWGMYLALDMAWRDHIPQLIVESDSKTLIDMVTGRCQFSGAIHTLVQRIRNLLALDWHVQFRHTWREGNPCADWLATFSLSLDSFTVTRLEYLPNELHRFLFDDFFWDLFS